MAARLNILSTKGRDKMISHHDSGLSRRTTRHKKVAKKGSFPRSSTRASDADHCSYTKVQIGAANTKMQTAAATHPDHTSALGRLRKIQGQISGIEKMITERRYCMDILIQFRAVASALNVIEGAVLEKHLRNCVRRAAESKDRIEAEAKIEELMNLILKRLN